jgi:aspartate aminotransferase
MVQLCGAVPRFIPAEAENNFKITAAQLRRHLSARSKVFILNSPSNPTGCVYTRAEISELAAVCAEKGIFIISDEIYEKIIFDGLRPFSPAALGKDVYELTVTVNGLSKSHSMTGWRIGYLGAHPAVAAAISSLQDHTTSNPTSIAQKAALAALQQQDGFTQQMCAEFEKRRDFACSRIAKMGKISCVRPQGAFYIFCDIAKTGLGSAVFANRLLEEESVALIPGEGFGRDDFARISFATSIEQLEKGLDRIERWLNNISATDDRGKNT